MPAAGEYVPMGQLVAGTALRTLDGRAATVVAVSVRRERAVVYNFEVAGTHTYFVAASQGGAGVWVHNAKCGGDRQLFRVVSEDEFQQIQRTGRFEEVPRSASGKYFWTNKKDAISFAREAFRGLPYRIVSVKLPTHIVDTFYHGVMDSKVAIYAPMDVLDELSYLIKEVVQ